MPAIGFWKVAAERPQASAIVNAEGETTTFAELEKRVNQLSHGLLQLGLNKGDAVAMVMANENAFLELLLATSQIGLYLIPINYHLTAPEIAYILENCEAQVCVSGASFIEACESAVAQNQFPQDRFFAMQGAGGVQDYEILLAGQCDTRPETRSAGQLMLYTSGTTGRPKGVRRPLMDADPDQAAMMAGMIGAIFNLKAGEGAHLVTGPLYHTAPGAFGMGSLHMGHTLVLMNKWEPEETLKLIEDYKITVSHMVPTMFYRMLALPEEVKRTYDLSSLECVIHGAAPITVEGKKKMIEWWGPVLFEYYGATEGVGSFVSSEEWLTKPGTVGKPMSAGSVVILDEAGTQLPAMEAGEIFLTPVMDFEYFKDKSKTEKSRSKDGLFTVGDVGYLDEDGYLFLCDRKNDMIISGGVNIYPAEVEKTLVLHEAVDDVAVFGIPDEDWGESVKAVVQLNPGYQESDELVAELLEFTKQSLAKYKLPRSIDFIEQLPRLDTGKLYKRILKDKYWQAQGKNI